MLFLEVEDDEIQGFWKVLEAMEMGGGGVRIQAAAAAADRQAAQAGRRPAPFCVFPPLKEPMLLLLFFTLGLLGPA